MWAYHDGFGWWMLFGGMGMLLFWGFALWFGVAIFRSIADRPHAESARHTYDAESILRRRFAAGEITEEEFRRAMNTLNGSQHRLGA